MTRLLPLAVLVLAASCSRVNPIAPECPGCTGRACTDAGTCNSGFCVDGVCCGSACEAACDRCNVAGFEGTCRVATAGDPGDPTCAPYVCNGTATTCATACMDDKGCAQGQYCDGYVCKPANCAVDGDCAPGNFCTIAGRCSPLLRYGQPCDRGAMCPQGNCVDGVCCNSACSDPCQKCSHPSMPGICGVADAGTAGRPGCGRYACNGASTQCPTSCTTNTTCTMGSACSGTACLADGDSDGTADVDDCDPADNMRYALRSCYRDLDQDGVFAPTAVATCGGASCPAGTRGDAGTDCDDSDAGSYQLLTCSFGPDGDGDGFYAGAGVATCTAGGCPDSGSSIRDCDDTDSRAKPGQRSYFAVPRDAGGFDYDCDGQETKDPVWDCLTNYGATAACQTNVFTGNRGYLGVVPSCGDGGIWRTCASWENATCSSSIYWFAGCGPGCYRIDGGTSFSVEDTARPVTCR